MLCFTPRPEAPQRLRRLLLGSASLTPSTADRVDDVVPTPAEHRQKKSKGWHRRLKLFRTGAGGCSSAGGSATSHDVGAEPASQVTQDNSDIVELAVEVERSWHDSPTKVLQPKGSSALDNVAHEAALPGELKQSCMVKGILCHGSYGPIYYTTRSATGQREVVKAIERSRLRQRRQGSKVWNEIKHARRLRHPNVAAITDVLQTPKHLFILMEFGGQRNLCHILQGSVPTAEQVCRVEAQLASALAYCHSQGVAHRDVCPRNVAVSNDGDQVKLVGFTSAALAGEACSDVAGTMPFLAPEVMEAAGPGAAAPYDPTSGDVWSCGVLLLEMLGGIGWLASALGWSAGGASVKPSAARALELRELLARGDAADVFGGLVAAAHSWDAGEDLLEVFAGTLDVEPQRQWTAAKLVDSAWLGRARVSGSG